MDYLNKFRKIVEQAWDVEPGLPSLFVMTAGLGGETGEVLDILKKWVNKGGDPTRLDYDHLREELGDVLYYWLKIVGQFGFSPEEVMKAQAKKLEGRYGVKID